MGLYLAYDSGHDAPAPARDNHRSTILVAVRPEDVELSKRIVGDEFNVVFCHSFDDACARLDDTVRLISCGVHFDNGKVFDFLRYVRHNPRTENLPFYIMLGAASRYSPAIVHGIRAAAKLLKVTGFTDLTRFADKIGNAEAIEALRKGIRDAIAAQEKQRATRPSSR